jgi:hypothetical protein
MKTTYSKNFGFNKQEGISEIYSQQEPTLYKTHPILFEFEYNFVKLVNETVY